MWPFKPSTHKYQAVAKNDDGEAKESDDFDVEEPEEQQKSVPTLGNRLVQAGTVIFLILCLSLAVFAIVVVTVSKSYGLYGAAKSSIESLKDQHQTVPSDGPTGCRARREWRTLTDSEKHAYISAVLCLQTTPSIIAPETNYTAYDDFPFIHSHVGYYTHHSAAFLPWHRYFLHIYETTLRVQCGYEGSLVYWDWTLDSNAIEGSPVFDSDTGFGGDGEVGGEITVSRTGRCVVDGPFAGITAHYYDVKYQPHCLSRGFRDLEGNLGHIDGKDITPESIEEVLSLESYEEFVNEMESRVHDAIPYGISGDFETFTAPYDPLFFLHHTQLDRLWWLWQQRQPDNGLTAYGGHKKLHTTETASMDDYLEMKGLAKTVQVNEVMNVQDELLCYTY